MERNALERRKEHPVPQNIMEVEFKLIGDLTLRQFLYLAGGTVIAYLLYRSPLFFLLKWPLVFLVGGATLMTAFYPYEERGIDQWIKNFFLAVYSPTQRIWKPREEVSEVSEVSEEVSEVPEVEAPGIPPKIKETIEFYKKEMERLGKEKEKEKEEKEKEEAPTYEEEHKKHLAALKGELRKIKEEREKVAKESEELKTKVEKEKAEKEEYLTKLRERETKIGRLTEAQRKAAQEIARLHRVMGRREQPKPKRKPKKEEEKLPLIKKPNTIGGIIRDKKGNLLSGILVIIRDQDGDPVRALKTNKLGQFYTSSPLPEGTYTVEMKGREREFGIQRIELEGLVTSPLEFRER